jgi:hypothetical protein
MQSKQTAVKNNIALGALFTAKALQAPFRSGVDIEDYQLDPLVRAVQMPRINLLIADDVGLANKCRLTEIRGKHITAQDLDSFTPGKPIECLIKSVGAVKNVGNTEENCRHNQLRYIFKLLRGTALLPNADITCDIKKH